MSIQTTPQALFDHYERLLRRSAQARKRERLDALNQGPALSLHAAGLEEPGRTPQLGFQGIPRIVHWFSDGEDSRYCEN